MQQLNLVLIFLPLQVPESEIDAVKELPVLTELKQDQVKGDVQVGGLLVSGVVVVGWGRGVV